MAALPDPKWLDVLKASGLQSFALAIACLGLAAGSRLGFLPAIPTWVTLVLAFVGLLSIVLSIGALGRGLGQLMPLHLWAVAYWSRRREALDAERYIPHMTAKEKEVIAYLLSRNQKTFIASMDGGFAMPLISRRIVVNAVQPGQYFDHLRTPFTVPDHIWAVLQEHRDDFPAGADERAKRLGHPWREPMI